MTVAGLFVDEAEPDAFVWMRGYPDHARRVDALTAFYRGPVWARNSAAANATMVDVDDVHLLRPVDPPHPPAPAVDRPDPGAPVPQARVVVEVLGIPDGQAGDTAEEWITSVAPGLIESALGVRVAMWRTDPTPNGFPALPVRTDRAVVWLAAFVDAGARERGLRVLDEMGLGDDLAARTASRTRSLLTPTPRSAHPQPVEVLVP